MENLHCRRTRDDTRYNRSARSLLLACCWMAYNEGNKFAMKCNSLFRDIKQWGEAKEIIEMEYRLDGTKERVVLCCKGKLITLQKNALIPLPPISDTKTHSSLPPKSPIKCPCGTLNSHTLHCVSRNIDTIREIFLNSYRHDPALTRCG